MQFFSTLAVLAAIAIAQVGPDRPVPHASARLALVVAGMLVLCGSASLVSRHAVGQIRRALGGHSSRPFRFRRWETVQAALCFFFTVAVLYGLGWPRMVRGNWGLDRWLLVDDAVILAPAMLPLFVSWLLFFDVDRALGSAGPHRGALADRWRYALLHARCHWLLILVPVVGLLVVRDLFGWFAPAVAGTSCESLVAVAYLALLMAFFPIALKCSWRTESLPAGPLRRRLDEATGRWKVDVRDFLLWRTDGRLVNAAATGVVSACRYVFLSDGLLARMTPAEIEAVCAHEMGHVHHHHVGLRMMAAIGPPLLLYGIARSLVGTESIGCLPLAGDPGVPTVWIVLLGVGLYAIACWGPYARLLEHQADWYACQKLAKDAMGRAAGKPACEGSPPVGARVPPGRSGAATSEAIEAGTARFAATLELLGRLSGQPDRRGMLLHPSTSRRIAFLVSLARSRRRARRFQLAMRWLAWGVVLAAAGGGVVAGTLP